MRQVSCITILKMNHSSVLNIKYIPVLQKNKKQHHLAGNYCIVPYVL